MTGLTNREEQIFNDEFAKHIDVAKQADNLLGKKFSVLVSLCLYSLSNGGKIIFFGNGGSAADAQHWAAELVVRFSMNRAAIPAVALTTDTSVLTAIGNDLGFEKIFSRQIEAIANEKDTVIGISTSGKSANVINGLIEAKKIGCGTAILTGETFDRTQNIADVSLLVPSTNTARIQEIHMIIGHALCKIIEERYLL